MYKVPSLEEIKKTKERTRERKESALPFISIEREGIKGKTMAEEGQEIGCHTVESWNQQLQLANASKKLVKIYSFIGLTKGTGKKLFFLLIN